MVVYHGWVVVEGMDGVVVDGEVVDGWMGGLCGVCGWGGLWTMLCVCVSLFVHLGVYRAVHAVGLISMISPPCGQRH